MSWFGFLNCCCSNNYSVTMLLPKLCNWILIASRFKKKIYIYFPKTIITKDWSIKLIRPSFQLVYVKSSRHKSNTFGKPISEYNYGQDYEIDSVKLTCIAGFSGLNWPNYVTFYLNDYEKSYSFNLMLHTHIYIYIKQNHLGLIDWD